MADFGWSYPPGCTDTPDDEVDDDEVTCPACGGTGDAPDNGTNQGICDECDGTGVVR